MKHFFVERSEDQLFVERSEDRFTPSIASLFPFDESVFQFGRKQDTDPSTAYWNASFPHTKSPNLFAPSNPSSRDTRITTLSRWRNSQASRSCMIELVAGCPKSRRDIEPLVLWRKHPFPPSKSSRCCSATNNRAAEATNVPKDAKMPKHIKRYIVHLGCKAARRWET